MARTRDRQYRQGDVFLREVPSFDGVNWGSAKKVAGRAGRAILADGEATGHHHSITAEKAQIWVVADETNPVIVVADDAQLEHQEHGTIEVGKGTFWVVRQKEYTPEAPRVVRD